MITKQILNIYSSIKEAGFKTNLNESGISKTCKHKQKQCGGFKWEYFKNNIPI